MLRWAACVSSRNQPRKRNTPIADNRNRCVILRQSSTGLTVPHLGMIPSLRLGCLRLVIMQIRPCCRRNGSTAGPPTPPSKVNTPTSPQAMPARAGCDKGRSNGHRRSPDDWTLSAGAINVAALAAANEQMTAPIAAAAPKAESKPGPDDAITGPIRAVAINPPVRATALFSPDAAPVWLLSTDIRTAVVSGATAPAIPKVITIIAGNTPSQ